MHNYKLIDSTLVEDPKVSVAMLAYNHEAFISQAIESALAQITTFNFEIVIAEDFSKDSTRQIVLDYQQRYPNQIKVILQNQNTGILQNNYALFENLGGKFIAILEGDDYWTDPFKLQKQVDFLEQNNEYVMVFTGCEILINDEGLANGMIGSLETREYKPLEIFKNWIVPTASIVFRNKYMKEIFTNCAYENIVYPDIILFLTLASKGKIYCMSEVMCVYRRHSGGVSIANPLAGKKAVSHFKAIKAIFGEQVKGVANNSIAKVYLNLGLTNFRSKPISSLKNLVMGSFYDFSVVTDYVKNKVYANKN